MPESTTPLIGLQQTLDLAKLYLGERQPTLATLVLHRLVEEVNNAACDLRDALLAENNPEPGLSASAIAHRFGGLLADATDIPLLREVIEHEVPVAIKGHIVTHYHRRKAFREKAAARLIVNLGEVS